MYKAAPRRKRVPDYFEWNGLIISRRAVVEAVAAECKCRMERGEKKKSQKAIMMDAFRRTVLGG